MDIRDRLKNPQTLRYADVLATEVVNEPAWVAEVFELIFDTDLSVAWRAAWTAEKIQQLNPLSYGESHWGRLSMLLLSCRHSGVARGCLSILLGMPVLSDVSVELINYCFDSMLSLKQPVAVQVLSMKLLLRICARERDFIPEMIVVLENCDASYYTPGFISSYRKALKTLKSM